MRAMRRAVCDGDLGDPGLDAKSVEFAHAGDLKPPVAATTLAADHASKLKLQYEVTAEEIKRCHWAPQNSNSQILKLDCGPDRPGLL